MANWARRLYSRGTATVTQGLHRSSQRAYERDLTDSELTEIDNTRDFEDFVEALRRIEQCPWWKRLWYGCWAYILVAIGRACDRY